MESIGGSFFGQSAAPTPALGSAAEFAAFDRVPFESIQVEGIPGTPATPGLFGFGGMPNISGILGGASTLMRSMTAYRSASAQASSLESQSDVLKAQAAWTELQMKMDDLAQKKGELSTTKRMRAILAYNKAAAGASGLSVSGFDPVQDQVVSEFRDEISTSRFNAKMKRLERGQTRSTLLGRAASMRDAASSTRKGRLWDAASPVVAWLGDAAGRGVF